MSLRTPVLFAAALTFINLIFAAIRLPESHSGTIFARRRRADAEDRAQVPDCRSICRAAGPSSRAHAVVPDSLLIDPCASPVLEGDLRPALPAVDGLCGGRRRRSTGLCRIGAGGCTRLPGGQPGATHGPRAARWWWPCAALAISRHCWKAGPRAEPRHGMSSSIASGYGIAATAVAHSDFAPHGTPVTGRSDGAQPVGSLAARVIGPNPRRPYLPGEGLRRPTLSARWWRRRRRTGDADRPYLNGLR